MSRLVMSEFGAKLIAYTLLMRGNTDFVFVHARAFGGARPVYALRFMEWAITLPMLHAMNNFPFVGSTDSRDFILRIGPNLLANFSFVVTAFTAAVTPNAFCGWLCLSTVLVTFIFTVVDQLKLVQGLRDTTTDYSFKLAVVVGKDLFCLSYGLMYVASLADLLTPDQENMFFAYSDVMLKTWQSSCLIMLRNWQDLVLLQRTLHGQVARTKEDTARLIRKANALMLSMDCDGLITGWNEHLADATCISEHCAVGKLFQDLVDPASKSCVENALKQCRAGLSTGGVELSLPIAGAGKPDGDSPLSVTILVSFIMQLGTDTSSIIVVGQDLTELVAQRALEERQARFESIVSHELRSPLHGIIGLSGAMVESTSDKMQKKQLSMIQGCADRLLDLINNIMEASTRDRHASATAPRSPVNVIEVIQEVVNMTRAAVDKAGKPLLRPGVRLANRSKCSRFPVVLGDSQKMAQMLYNLTINACKFTTKGEVSIALKYEPDFSPGMVDILITDTGPGIASNSLKRIFEPFEQEDSKDSRRHQGVGLGLSVAQGIARWHGGEIQVQSAIGKGSTFTVRLPCDESMSLSYSRPMSEEAVVSAPGPRTDEELEGLDHAGDGASVEIHLRLEQFKSRADELGARKERQKLRAGKDRPLILCIDSDAVNQQVVMQSLGPLGRVHTVKTGTEALEFLERTTETPKLVIIDLLLPGMCSLEVCMEIRERLSLSHLALPIIVLGSKLAGGELSWQVFAAGATDCLQKPFTSSLLRVRAQIALELQEEFSRGASEAADLAAFAAIEEGCSDDPSKCISDQAVKRLNASLAGCRAELKEARQERAEERAKLERAEAEAQRERTEGLAKLERAEASACEDLANLERAEAQASKEAVARAAAVAREEVLQSARAELEAALREQSDQMHDLRSELQAALAESEARRAEVSAQSSSEAVARQREAMADREGTNSTLDTIPDLATVYKFPGADAAASSAAAPYIGGEDACDFYRCELDNCRQTLEALRMQLSCKESEAYLQRNRADAGDREVLHLRGQLRRCLEQLPPSGQALRLTEG